ncbi:MAG: MgtC/SapB family protein [Bacteroidetes bacterium]|nr:MAG: MgtC/SapB family protein [Bacteroidota bacterium]
MDHHLTTLGIALGLGLLVGLTRERAGTHMAGIRTFPLITLLGAVSGILASLFDNSGLIIAGMLAVAWLFGVANFLKRNEPAPEIGQTTEVAALLMFVLGAALVFIPQITVIILGAVVALLLYLKKYLSEIVHRLGEKDIQSIMLFVAVSLVILPLLPDKNFGPYQVLNLREIWWMVVLIVGLGLSGYFAYKWLGKSMGVALSGILGGLISSTATSVIYAKQTRTTATAIRLAAFVIVAASTVAFLRVLLEVSVVAPGVWPEVAPPIGLVALCLIALSVGLFFYNENEHIEVEPPENPAQFKTALVFAFIYALILLAVAYVKNEFGAGGLYFVAFLSGLTDMDAITLSLSNMMNDGRMESDQGWQLILLAALSNLIFKGGMVAFFGHRKLFRMVAPAFGVALVAGALVLAFCN